LASRPIASKHSEIVALVAAAGALATNWSQPRDVSTLCAMPPQLPAAEIVASRISNQQKRRDAKSVDHRLLLTLETGRLAGLRRRAPSRAGRRNQARDGV
jgi:hypothetical protein